MAAQDGDEITARLFVPTRVDDEIELEVQDTSTQEGANVNLRLSVSDGHPVSWELDGRTG